METALRRIADMLEAFFDAAAAWFATGAWRPEVWPGITWVLVAAFVVLVWLLAWRRRAPRGLDVRPPQLLVTSGEVVPDGTAEPAPSPSGRRRRRPAPVAHAEAGAFAMTVSNLSRYPVQLLEVALRDGRRGAPRVATVDAVVPAMGSVTVSGRVALGLRGDGWLDVYCYAAAPRVKMHRHRVELVWEPWAARFKAAPLEQISAPTRRLASDEPDARFLEDVAPEPEPAGAVAVAIPARPAERREATTASAPPVDDAAAWPPEPVAPEPMAREPMAPAPTPPAREPVAPDVADVADVGSVPGVPAAPRSKAPRAQPAKRAHPAGHEGPPSHREARASQESVADEAPVANGSIEAAPSGAPRPPSSPAEARGVPRIATPPVGVAVTGRGGASARTADGWPIGRPTVRSERAPAASDPIRDAAATDAPRPAPVRPPEGVPRTPAPPAAPSGQERPAAPSAPTPRPDRAAPAAPTKAEEDEPAPAAQRRPRLEFPDEF